MQIKILSIVFSEAVHAWDHSARCCNGSRSSRGGKRVEPEPRGPEWSHIREVWASDQPWRCRDLLLSTCLIRFPQKLFRSYLRMMSFAESEFRYARWKKAVEKSMNWETTEPVCNGNGRQDHTQTKFSLRTYKYELSVSVGPYMTHNFQ